MYDYLKILQEKAKKIDADIEVCGYDKECIKDALASKARSNLENEELYIIKEKAIKIDAVINTNTMDKNSLLDAIEERIKKILEEENELYSSIEAQKGFMPLDLA